MKKISGKVVSLVLALALVVTSFSTAAFAATRNQTAKTASDLISDLYLSNGGANSAELTVDLLTERLTAAANPANFKLTTDEPIRGAVSLWNLTDVVMTSGSGFSKLVTERNNDGYITKADLVLTDNSKTGTITIAARYVGVGAPDANGNTVTYSATASLNVIVLQKGSTIIGKSNSTVSVVDSGTKVPGLADMAKTDSGTFYGAIYTVAHGATNARANDTANDLTTSFTEHATTATENGKFLVTYTGNTSVTRNPTLVGAGKVFQLDVKATTSAKATKSPYAVLGSGNVRAVKAIDYTTGAGQKLSKQAVDMANATAAVVNTIDLTGATYAGIFTAPVIANYRGVSYIFNGSVPKDSDDITNVSALIVAGANVTAGTGITINSGSVGKISADGAVSMSDGIVGEIVTTGTVDISKGTVNGKVEGTTVTIAGGTVGNVTGSVTVNLKASSDKVATVAKDVSAPVINVGESTNSNSIRTGSLIAKSDANNTTINITGKNVTVAGISANWATGNVAINYVKFTGAGLVPTKVATLAATNIASNVDGDSVVTYPGSVALTDITVNGKVVLGATTSINNVYGSGTVTFVPGSLKINQSLSTVKMKPTTEVKVGDVLFTAAPYVVYPSNFTSVGYTAEVVTGTTLDTIKVKSVDFYGIQFKNDVEKLVVGNKITLSAGAYPSTTALPKDYTVKYSFSGGDDYFKVTANDNGTVTIEALKYEKIFSSLNDGVLTATLYDEYGVQSYQYDVATCNISIVEKAAYTIDTKNLQLKTGSTYQYKITTSDGVEPTVTVGTSGVVTLVKSGADSANKAFFFKVTPVAGVKAGTQVGLYVNGVKADVITVVAGDTYKLDTTKVTVEKGKSYQVKATSATAPTVVAGSSSFTVSAVTKVGNDFFFKVTPSANAKSGDVCGIYVNGEKTPAMTATVK